MAQQPSERMIVAGDTLVLDVFQNDTVAIDVMSTSVRYRINEPQPPSVSLVIPQPGIYHVMVQTLTSKQLNETIIVAPRDEAYLFASEVADKSWRVHVPWALTRQEIIVRDTHSNASFAIAFTNVSVIPFIPPRPGVYELTLHSFLPATGREQTTITTRNIPSQTLQASWDAIDNPANIVLRSQPAAEQSFIPSVENLRSSVERKLRIGPALGKGNLLQTQGSQPPSSSAPAFHLQVLDALPGTLQTSGTLATYQQITVEINNGPISGLIAWDVTDIPFLNLDVDVVPVQRLQQIVTSAAFADQDLGTPVRGILVDPAGLPMRQGIIYTEAKGRTRYLCAAWNTTTEMCTVPWTALGDAVPGYTYTLDVTDKPILYIETGVATINARDAVSSTGSTNNMVMAVLDTEGHLVKGANLTVRVEYPDTTTQTILTSSITETSRGIYETTLDAGPTEGIVRLHVDANGQGVNATLASQFLVNNSFPFQIERNAPSSVDPWQGPFEASLQITSTNTPLTSFTVTEQIPHDWTIIESHTGLQFTDGNRKYIRWENVTSDTELLYTIQPPYRTPDLGALGPALIETEQNEIIEEPRVWWIAIDPVQISSTSGSAVAAIAMDNTTLVIAWVELGGATNKTRFAVYDTEGRTILAATDIDATSDSDSRIALAPLSTTAFAFAEIDGPTDDLKVGIFNISGSTEAALSQVDAAVGTFTDVSLASNGSLTAICYTDQGDGDANTLVMNRQGTIVVAEVNVDTTQAPDATLQNYFECTPMTSSSFALTWFDDQINNPANRIKFEMRNYADLALTFAGATVDMFGAVIGEGGQTSITRLQNYPNTGVSFGITAYDFTANDVSFTIRNFTGSSYTIPVAVTDIDINAGTTSRVASAEVKYGSEYFLASVWQNTAGNNISAAVYNRSTTAFTNTFRISGSPNVTYNLIDAVGWHSYLNQGLCPGAFAVVYISNASVPVFDTFFINGSSWNGRCDAVAPNVTLEEPLNNSIIESTTISFNFTVRDNHDTVIPLCSLWGNFSGAFALNMTIGNLSNGTKSNFTIALNDSRYSWNVICTDNSSNRAWGQSNFSVFVNAVPPNITNAAINKTVINQSERIQFNVSLFDRYGISKASIELLYPNATTINLTLTNVGGNTFAVNITNTFALGTYNITSITVNDTLGQQVINTTYFFLFNVTASPPSVFNLTHPANNTYSTNLTPYVNWTIANDTHFRNYTIFFSDSSAFAWINHTNTTTSAGNTSLQFPIVLANDTRYYWYVTAFDNFSNARNSSSFFQYTTDTTLPQVTLSNPADASFVTTNPVYLNFTPFDTNLQNCTLYVNVTGFWVANETNSTPANAVENGFTKQVPDGTYLWNVRCDDAAGLISFAIQNRSFTVDTVGPTTLLEAPENHNYTNRSNIVIFKYNATDNGTTIDNCRFMLDDIQQGNADTTITESVSQNFTVFVPNGEHNWSINCTDALGFETSSEHRNITVDVGEEHDPPVITLLSPDNDFYSSTNNLTFIYTATDGSGIENCTFHLNGTANQTNYTVENTVPQNFTVERLNEGYYTWRIDCYDNASFANDTSGLRNFTVDLTNPFVTLNWPSENAWYNDTPTLFNYTPIDANLNNCSVMTNATGFFVESATNTSPMSGFMNSISVSLPDKPFLWNVECVDKSGRSGHDDSNRTIRINVFEPTITSILTNPESPLSYNETYTIRLQATMQEPFLDTVWLETNSSGILNNMTITNRSGNEYSINLSNLPARGFVYRWIANDTQGRNNATTYFSYNIIAGSPIVNLTLNGTDGNFSAIEDMIINITVKTQGPSLPFILVTTNGNNLTSGYGPIENLLNFSVPGLYNITASYPETENYTFASDTHFLLINDTQNPTVELQYPENNATTGSSPVAFGYLQLDEGTNENCSIYINGSINATRQNILFNTTDEFVLPLSNGKYTWKVGCYDALGQYGESTVRNITVFISTNIILNVSSPQSSWDPSTFATFTATTEDYYGNPLNTSLTFDIIKGITKVNWWDTAWSYRQPLLITNTQNTSREEILQVVVRNLSSRITSCTNDIRIVQNRSTSQEVMPFAYIAGDDATNCTIQLKVITPAQAVNESSYHVYYGNPAAPSGSSTLSAVGLKVQRGTLDITTLQSTASASFPEQINTTKTFITFTSTTNSGLPNRNQYTVDTPTSSAVGFTRYSTGTTSQILWQAIEHENITVQRGTQALLAADENATITINAVNTNQSFIIVNGRVNSGNANQNVRGLFRAYFMNATTIVVERKTTATAATISYQVVEWPGSRVHGNSTSTAAASIDVTIADINMAKSFVIADRAISGSTNADASYIFANITSQTNLQISRQTAAGTLWVSWFVVDLPGEFRVANQSIVLTGSVTANISAVDTSNTFHMQSWSAAIGSTSFQNGLWSFNLTNTTAMQLLRTAGTESTWMVLYTIEEVSSSIATGNEQETILRNQTTTETAGVVVFELNSTGRTYTNYSAVVRATRYNFTNESQTVPFMIVPDTIKPAIQFLFPTPTNGTTLATTSIFINASANEALSTMLLEWNGTNYSMNSYTPTLWYVQKTGLTNGTYWYLVHANDTAGNFNHSETRTVTIDTILPAIRFTDPTPFDQAIQFISTVVINITANENLSAALLEWNSINMTMTGGNTSWNITLAGLSNGTYFYRVHGNDTASNFNQTEVRTIIIDQVPPSLRLLSPANDATFIPATIPFAWNATDEWNTTIRCNLTIDGSVVNNSITNRSGGIWNVSYHVTAPGNHSWNVTCQDQFNSTNTSATRSFIVLIGPQEINISVTNDNRSTFITWSNVSYIDSFSLYISTNFTQGFPGYPSTPNMTGITRLNITDGNASNTTERYYLITAQRGSVRANASYIVGKKTILLLKNSVENSSFNLVSNPFFLSDPRLTNQSITAYSPPTNPGGCINSIWRYNESLADIGGYETTYLQDGLWIPALGSENFTSMDFNRGYWYEVNATCNMTFTGRVVQINSTIFMTPGYNIETWPSLRPATLPTTTEPPSYPLVLTPANTIWTLNRYNTATNTFEVTVHYNDTGWVPSANNIDFTTLEAGRGYFMDVTAPTTWTIEPRI